jgi:nitronate monooxygenase
MMLRTKLSHLLGIQVPILGAPMGFVTGPELAAAVSNAGGLGIMSFSGNPPAVMREQIQHLRSLTSNPFGVNVLLSGPHLPFPVDAVIGRCRERFGIRRDLRHIGDFILLVREAVPSAGG